MVTSAQKRALLIAGPTASGKSALALAEAGWRGGVIINADALQVYRELRILTARPSPAEEASLPHRLYGHVPGAESYSVGRWFAEVSRVLDETWAQGRLPVIVGGTGLYFAALERGLADVPAIPAPIRDRWRGFAGDLHGELSRRDPEAAARLGPADRQRLIRALEVIEATGRPLSEWQRQARAAAPLSGVAVERLFVDLPRPELLARAEARFDRMVAEGAIEEVRRIVDFDPALPMMKAIGVPELAALLRGEIRREEAVRRAKAATRQYIKRQLTWWRGQGKEWREAAGPPAN